MRVHPILLFLCPAFACAQSTQPALPGGDWRYNIDILPISPICVKPGDTFSFEVVTRLGGGGTGFGLGNIDYTVNLGSLTSITFEGVRADGSFIESPASTNGAVSGNMIDTLDADNEFLMSSDAAEFGILRSDDILDRPDPDDNVWQSDWVIQLDWTVPLDAENGTYEVTAEEEVDIFTADGQTEDFATAQFPGSHTPFSIKVVPEPSATLLTLIALPILLRRSRKGGI